MSGQILLLAKAPVPGRVKTRLCPPCTPEQAARVAAAALDDTLDSATATPAMGRVLVLDGQRQAPAGWTTVAQRGGPLADRLVAAFADTRRPGVPALLIGMDTPQVTPELLTEALRQLAEPGGPDAVLGLAVDGGWWALGLREPRDAEALRHIVTSTATTGAETLAALRERGLRVGTLPRLRDVDTAADAHLVAAVCPPGGRFAGTVHGSVPEPARPEPVR
ncbi:DUF2064 domain-containing protein [Paractinoplanes ferrugineus]|uniref:Glycosyltransferase n=1 Tax=Paractinoplanes ferrugineus TaxID=113564 RepID=A0A919JCH1_9ACTN|nr:DUF2064 domain-containing protein [Actinoplanes ferrugineus]GIE14631.1 hypothetical protein Afe05nite_64710 [Actinoplanes ferrugineus]